MPCFAGHPWLDFSSTCMMIQIWENLGLITGFSNSSFIHSLHNSAAPGVAWSRGARGSKWRLCTTWLWGQFWHKLSKHAFASCICQGILDFQADSTLKVLPEWCTHSKLGGSCAFVFVSREAQGGLKENSVLSPEEVDKPTSFFFP